MSALSPPDPSESFARTVYAQYREALRSFLHHQGVDAPDTEDVLQEVIKEAWRAREAYDPAQNFGAWLFGIARNVARHYRRQPHRRHEELTEDVGLAVEAIPDARPGPDDHLMHRERLGVVAAMVASVKAERRDVFIQHKLEEIPLAEVARAKGISPKTVSSQVDGGMGDCRSFGRRWAAADRAKGGDGEPILVPPLFTTHEAANENATRAGRPRLSLAVAKGIVALLGLGCMSPPSSVQPALEIDVSAYAVHVPAPVATTPAAPAAMPASSPPPATASQTTPARPLRPRGEPGSGTARQPENRAPGDSLESRLLILRSEAEHRAGNHDEALRALIEHRRRFPEGPLTDKRHRMLRELGSM